MGVYPGKVLGLFEVRSQQWLRLEWHESSTENCKVEVLDFLAGLGRFTLLLFDLGYFSFTFFDQLTELGWWWISRYREKTSYRVVHVFYRHQEVLDALVWLGSGSTQAGRLVRLVRFGDGQQVRMYLTNVLDAHHLSIAAIARLYARSFDIESAFRVLKDYLGMNQWWSGKQELIWIQIWVVLMVAHVLTALQMQIAEHSGRDPFEVSLPLLIKLLPRLRCYEQNIVEWVCEHGEQAGVLRASPRLKVRVPQVALQDYREAPPDLQTQRTAHRVIYEAGPPKPSYSGYKAQAAKRQGAAA
jgi:hypothetical protein